MGAVIVSVVDWMGRKGEQAQKFKSSTRVQECASCVWVRKRRTPATQGMETRPQAGALVRGEVRCSDRWQTLSVCMVVSIQMASLYYEDILRTRPRRIAG
jgi:hypothetical protein